MEVETSNGGIDIEVEVEVEVEVEIEIKGMRMGEKNPVPTEVGTGCTL
ncbi:MAG: hypothetical protein AB1428_07495 [Bacteroidota bacterium]